MNEFEIYEKIRELPQTRYTLGKTKTDLIKVNKNILRLVKRNLIQKRYYHVDGSLQVVYLPIDFKGFLVNYRTDEDEFLMYFTDYDYEGFAFKIKNVHILMRNEWQYFKKMYIDKNRIRCF